VATPEQLALAGTLLDGPDDLVDWASGLVSCTDASGAKLATLPTGGWQTGGDEHAYWFLYSQLGEDGRVTSNLWTPLAFEGQSPVHCQGTILFNFALRETPGFESWAIELKATSTLR
jgi:hypothetical protein